MIAVTVMYYRLFCIVLESCPVQHWYALSQTSVSVSSDSAALTNAVIIGSKSHILHLLWVVERFFGYVSPKPERIWMKPGM